MLSLRVSYAVVQWYGQMDLLGYLLKSGIRLRWRRCVTDGAVNIRSVGLEMLVNGQDNYSMEMTWGYIRLQNRSCASSVVTTSGLQRVTECWQEHLELVHGVEVREQTLLFGCCVYWFISVFVSLLWYSNDCLVRTGVVKVVCSVVSSAVIMSVCVFTITWVVWSCEWWVYVENSRLVF